MTNLRSTNCSKLLHKMAALLHRRAATARRISRRRSSRSRRATFLSRNVYRLYTRGPCRLRQVCIRIWVLQCVRCRSMADRAAAMDSLTQPLSSPKGLIRVGNKRRPINKPCKHSLLVLSLESSLLLLYLIEYVIDYLIELNRRWKFV